MHCCTQVSSTALRAALHHSFATIKQWWCGMKRHRRDASQATAATKLLVGHSGQALWWPEMLSRGEWLFFGTLCGNTWLWFGWAHSILLNKHFLIFPKIFLRYWKKAKIWSSCRYFLAPGGSRIFPKPLLGEATKAHWLLMPKEPTWASLQQDVVGRELMVAAALVCCQSQIEAQDLPTCYRKTEAFCSTWGAGDESLF